MYSFCQGNRNGDGKCFSKSCHSCRLLCKIENLLKINAGVVRIQQDSSNDIQLGRDIKENSSNSNHETFRSAG